MSFSISGGKEYDQFGNAANIGDGSTDLGPTSGVTGADNDNDFEFNEDITGGGNLYLGVINIGGLDYPVMQAASGGVPATDNCFILVPDYPPYPAFGSVSFPATIDFIQDVTQSTFSYCFAAGTLIETSVGNLAVEDLTRDHLVKTETGDFEAVKWIGRQTILKHFSGGHGQMVRIGAGSLGENVPMQDLLVTSDHGMMIGGLVVNASALVNGSTIDFVPSNELDDVFTVYHVETENHDVIYANGAPSETFIDVANRSKFDNYQDYLDLFGAERIVPEMQAPRISSKRLLPQSIRQRLGISRRNDAPHLDVA